MQNLVFATCITLSLLNTAAHAQWVDTTSSGMPTLSGQCTMNPGLCDGPGSSGGTYVGGSDPFGALLVPVVVGLAVCWFTGTCSTSADTQENE